MSSPKSSLVALIRRSTGLDENLTDFDVTVRRNFQTWIMQKHAGTPGKFTEAQTAWLQLIRDHISTSFRFDREDLDYAPFDAQAGLVKCISFSGKNSKLSFPTSTKTWWHEEFEPQIAQNTQIGRWMF